MKKLIWKELMEQKFIPLACAILAVMAFGAWYLFDIHNIGDRQNVSPDILITVVTAGIVLAGLLPGGRAFAPETNDGTLIFLTTLPTGRGRIWAAKVIAGLLVTFASVALILLSITAVAAVLYDGTINFNGVLALLDGGAPGDERGHVWFIAAGALPGYAIALIVSTLVDSSLTAMVLALIFELGLSASVINLVGGFSQEPHVIGQFMYVIFGIVTLSCLFASNCVYRYGESLRTTRRFLVVTVALAICLVGGMLTVAAYAHVNPISRLPIQKKIDLGDVLVGQTVQGSAQFTLTRAELAELPAEINPKSSAIGLNIASRRIVLDASTIDPNSDYLPCQMDFSYTAKNHAGPDSQSLTLMDQYNTEIAVITVKCNRVGGK